MKNFSTHVLIILLASIALSSCSKKVIYSAPYSISKENTSTLSAEKQLAYQFVTSTKEEKADLEETMDPSFVSHDQTWKGQKADFVANRNSDESFTSIEPVRILHDGSLVAVQSRMIGDTLRFRWDIVRIEKNKIQEHWSNVHDSIGLNPNGHTEIDGPTVPEQFEMTDTNRAHVAQFMDQCMIREDGGAAKFFDFGLYIQHNRDVGDGLLGLLKGMRKMKKAGKVIKFKYNYHVIAEGNFVLSATEGYVGADKYTFYDLFRIEENKIVEHWDIIAPVSDFIYFQAPD